MSYYDDVLNAADSQLGTDWNADATREEAFKALVVSFKAQPKENVSIAHTHSKETEWVNNAEAAKVKTASKFTLKAHGVNFSTTFANDKFAGSAAGELLKEQDWTVKGSASGEYKPAKKEHKATGAAQITSPDFSGVKSFVNLSAEHNDKNEWKINAKVNLNVQKDHNFGVSTEHDAKNFTKIFAQISTKDGDNTYWIRSNVLTKTINLGCIQKYAKFSHSYNAEYGTEAGFKGFQGQPVIITAGGFYGLSDATTFNYNATAGESYKANLNFNHKIDSHWKVGAHQHFDGSRLNTKRNPYDLGFNIEYNL